MLEENQEGKLELVASTLPVSRNPDRDSHKRQRQTRRSSFDDVRSVHDVEPVDRRSLPQKSRRLQARPFPEARRRQRSSISISGDLDGELVNGFSGSAVGYLGLKIEGRIGSGKGRGRVLAVRRRDRAVRSDQGVSDDVEALEVARQNACGEEDERSSQQPF